MSELSLHSQETGGVFSTGHASCLYLFDILVTRSLSPKALVFTNNNIYYLSDSEIGTLPRSAELHACLLGIR